MKASRVCTLCGTEKPLDEFVRDPGKPQGYGSRCNSCNRARCASAAYKAKERPRHQRYSRDPLKAFRERVQRKLRRAVRLGKIERKGACERCGSREHVESHHADYGKPLDVTWLCRACHVREHAIREFVGLKLVYRLAHRRGRPPKMDQLEMV